MLNSRPLVPLDSVATDGIAPLTPGHFLIGAPLAALPSLPDQTSYTSLRRWNLVQHLTDELWQRWQTDYLTHLQRRSKWKQAQHNLQVNDIVLMKDVSLFQRTWKLGRVAAIYKGTDGLVRVVDVTKGQKTYRRPGHKLVKLLREENDFSSWGGCSGRLGERHAVTFVGMSDERSRTLKRYILVTLFCFVLVIAYTCIVKTLLLLCFVLYQTTLYGVL